MGVLADSAFSRASLTPAWEDVLAGDREDGVLGPAVQRFADEADERITRLVTDLTWGAYRPSHLTEIALPGGGRPAAAARAGRARSDRGARHS